MSGEWLGARKARNESGGGQLMRVAFAADEGGFEADESALICGVAGGGRWLTFQRDPEDSPDDPGIHLEYTGQGNGGYGCVLACRISDAALSIDLARQLGGLAGVTGFDVALQFEPEQISAVRAGLRQVFRGHLDKLADAGPGGAVSGGGG